MKKEVKEYSFAVPRLFGNLSAEDAAKELERISNEYGELKPEYVVESAKDVDSVLHSVFEWDDTKAADLYRLDRARTLIGSIRVTIKHKKVDCKIRAFVNVRQEEHTPRSYVPIHKTLENECAYNDMLAQAKRDMQTFIDNYSQIEELNAVKAEMLKVLNS